MTQELEVYEAPAPATLFGTDDPSEVIAKATAAAQPLAEVVVKQELYKQIGTNKHVLVEGWCLLGSMLGVFPVTVWTKPIMDSAGTTQGFEARVEARTKHGEVVGAAEAQCTRDETLWGWNPVNKWGKPLDRREDFALRSMAQTRATSKALRQPLGFVMTLAGFSATPEEEMPRNAEPEPPIEDAVIVDPEGNPFPDDPGNFQQPTGPRGGDGPLASDAQRKMVFRLRKKLTGPGFNQPEAPILAEIAKRTTDGGTDDRKLTKAGATDLISKLKKLAGESDD